MKRLPLALLGGVLVVGLCLFVPWREDRDWDPDARRESATNVDPGAGTLAASPLRDGETDTDEGEANAVSAPNREQLAPGVIRVVGRLVNKNGAPVGDTKVDLHLGDGRQRGGWSPFAMAKQAKKADRETRSDAEGRFVFKVPVAKGGQLALPEGDLVWEKRPPRFLSSHEDLDLGELAVFRGAVMRGRVLGPDDQPIAKVKLRFMGYEGHGHVPRAADSDAKGRFELLGLPRGDGYLMASCGGHVGLYKRITIAGGETLDGVIVRMRRGAELVGLVVDDRWQPIREASVKVSGPGQRTEEGYEYTNGSAKTDAQGAFRVAGLGKAPYTVHVKAKGHVPKSLQNVRSGEGEVRLELLRLGSVAGHVVDERGQPIAGSSVHWTTKEPGLGRDGPGLVEVSMDWSNFGPGMMHNPGQRGNSVKTDEQGRFVLENINPGRIWLVAGGAHPRAVHGPLEIVAGTRLGGVEIAARRGGVATIHVFDPDGKPIEKAQVQLSQPNTQANRQPGLPMGMGRGPRSRRVASGRTDKDGKCELAGVEAGEYQVRATHQGWVSPEPVRLAVPARGRVETRLVMQAGGTVAIRVVDHRGQPAAEQAFKILQAQQQKKSGRTDATGRATVGPLAEGDYEAVLQNTASRMPWGFYGNQSAGAEIGAPATFHVSANKTADVVLTRPKLASLSGTVRDDSGLRTSARIWIMARPASPKVNVWDMAVMSTMQHTRTDGDGVFQFEGLLPGDYALAVQPDRKSIPFQVGVLIQGTEAHVKHIYLTAGSVQVEVRSGSKPLAGVDIGLYVQGNTPISWQAGVRHVSAVSDAEGVASFPPVPPGEYTIRIQSKDYAKTDLKPFEVMAGALARKTLDVEQGATLSVECVPPEGQPANPGTIQVELTRDGTGNKPTQHWLHGPANKLERLRPGRYQVRARKWRQQGGVMPWSPAQSVDLQLGKPNHVRILLP